MSANQTVNSFISGDDSKPARLSARCASLSLFSDTGLTHTLGPFRNESDSLPFCGQDSRAL